MFFFFFLDVHLSGVCFFVVVVLTEGRREAEKSNFGTCKMDNESSGSGGIWTGKPATGVNGLKP